MTATLKTPTCLVIAEYVYCEAKLYYHTICSCGTNSKRELVFANDVLLKGKSQDENNSREQLQTNTRNAQYRQGKNERPSGYNVDKEYCFLKYFSNLGANNNNNLLIKPS